MAAEAAASPPAITASSAALVTEAGSREPAATVAARDPAASPRAAQPQRLRGVVQWFGDRGYGFLHGEDGRDVFVHRSAIARGMFPRLTAGQLVEYEVQETAKGLQAVAVTPLQGSAARGR